MTLNRKKKSSPLVLRRSKRLQLNCEKKIYTPRSSRQSQPNVIGKRCLNFETTIEVCSSPNNIELSSSRSSSSTLSNLKSSSPSKITVPVNNSENFCKYNTMTTFTNDQFKEFLDRICGGLQVSGSIGNSGNDKSKPSGNFAHCTNRFDGRKEFVTSFVNSIKIYKTSTCMTNENALLGFPLLLEGEASLWWEGVSASVTTFDEALELLISTFSVVKPAYLLYQEIFSQRQSETEKTDHFICKIRAMFSKLPNGELNEKIQLDMSYGLLSRRIREKVKRENITTFEDLLRLSRIEENFFTELDNSQPKFIRNPIANNQVSENKSKLFCRYCKSKEHNISECPKKN